MDHVIWLVTSHYYQQVSYKMTPGVLLLTHVIVTHLLTLTQTSKRLSAIFRWQSSFAEEKFCSHLTFFLLLFENILKFNV